MRAVNLIPSDQRRGAGTGGGLATYALLGALLLVLAGVTAYVVVANQIHQRKSDLARATQRRQVADAQVSSLQPYVQFAQLEQQRLATVHQIAATRFDWERTMDGLARVTTSSVWLTSMLGTVTPDTEVDGANAAASDLRSDVPVPAVELAGCAASNRAVVAYLTRLRALKGVTRVSLSDAQKRDASSTGTTGASTSSTSTDAAASSSDCGPSTHTPAFDAVVFFDAMPGTPDASGDGGATPTTGTTPVAAPAGGTG